MLSYRVIGPLMVVLLLLLGVRCSSDVEPEQLVEGRCTRCHTLAPIEVSRKTSEEWTRTVYRMIGKGARLDEEEAQAVIEYLSETYGAEMPMDSPPSLSGWAGLLPPLVDPRDR